MCVFPVSRPTPFFPGQITDPKLFFRILPEKFVFCVSGFNIYKIKMAATVAATSLLAIRVKKCKHISEKNAILCLENRRTLLDIFIDLHGDLPKDSRLSIVCNNSTDPSKGTSFDVYPNMLVGDLVGTFAIKRIEYSCSTEEQTVALGEIINNAAEAATSKTVDAFQVLMAGGRKNVSLKTSRFVLKES